MRFGKPVLLASGLVALVAVVAWGKLQQPGPAPAAGQAKAEPTAPPEVDAAIRQCIEANGRRQRHVFDFSGIAEHSSGDSFAKINVKSAPNARYVLL